MSRIKRALKKSGLSQRELAEATGLSRSMISRVLSGERMPTLPHALKLARKLDIPVEGFMRRA
ncbi:MAG: helix-turn-helix transcriptional regulator [Acidobacteria bacterium]|nr:helix-turn-helix transcriptional regulator [Acidobacteriota bacterium]